MAPANGGRIIIPSTRIDSADQQGIIISLHYCGISWWSLWLIISLLQSIRPTTAEVYYPCQWVQHRPVGTIIYYSIIRMDPADHARGLLFASITVGSADGPYGLLFLHCHRSGQPPQRFIILIDRYSIGQWGQLFIILLSGWTRPTTTPGFYYYPPLLWDRLMVLIDYYLPIAMDPADL